VTGGPVSRRQGWPHPHGGRPFRLAGLPALPERPLRFTEAIVSFREKPDSFQHRPAEAHPAPLELRAGVVARPVSSCAGRQGLAEVLDCAAEIRAGILACVTQAEKGLAELVFHLRPRGGRPVATKS